MVEIISHAFKHEIKKNFRDRGYNELHFYTITPGGNSTLIRFKDYLYSCYIECPEKDGHGNSIHWTETCNEVSTITRTLKKFLKDDAFVSYEFYAKDKIHYYNSKTYVLELKFKIEDHMNHLVNLLKGIKDGIEFSYMGRMKLSVFENNISIIRKLITEKNLKYCQWMSVVCEEIPLESPERISVKGGDIFCPKGHFNETNREYFGDYNTMKLLTEEEASKLKSSPRLLSFDIETYSDNHRAMPKKLNPLHPSIIISCIYARDGDPSSRRYYAVVLGDCDDVFIDGIKVAPENIFKVNTEVDEINKFTDLIFELDPDVITGYNIFAYDYPYLNIRLLRAKKQWKCCGRIKNEKPYMFEDTWESSAYGKQNINILEMSGRISVDMLVVVRRNYGTQLPKCDLNTVSKTILKKEKHDITAPQMFKAYEMFMKADYSLKHTLRDLELLSLLDNDTNIDGGTDNDKAALKILSKSNNKFIKDLLEENEKINRDRYKATRSRDLNKRIESKINVEKFELKLENYNTPEGLKEIELKLKDDYNKAKAELTRIVAYCIQDSILVIDLWEKLFVWIGLIQFSGVVGIDMPDLFTRGQQIRCVSQIFDEATKSGFILDKRYSEKLHFKGAFVAKPVVGFHTKIIGLDFNSLYPSIIIAYNLCYSTFIRKEDWNSVPDEYCHIIKFSQEEPYIPVFKDVGNQDYGNNDTENNANEDEDEEVVEVEVEDDKTKKEVKMVTRHYEFRFVKKNIREGILPRLLTRLIAERKRIRAQQKVVIARIKSFKKYFNSTNSENIILDTNTSKEYKEWYNFASKYDNYDDLKVNFKIWLESQEHIWSCWEQEQLATKVSANSMYGFLGAQTKGMMPLIEAAMCVTALGRQLIGEVNKYVIEKYNAVIIYGDTDSSMIDFHIEHYKDCEEWGHRMEDEINGVEQKVIVHDDGTEEIIPAKAGLFLSPLRMEFEKAMDIFCICPKKYAALFINKDGSYKRDDHGELVLLLKGLLLARRDNHPKIREIYKTVLMNILLKVDIDTTFKYLIDEIVNLLQNKVPASQLSIIRGIGSNYKNNGFFIKVFAGELARMGNPVQPGDRVSYVVVKTAEENEKVFTARTVKNKIVPLGLKMRMLEMWETSQEEAAKPEEEKIKGDEASYIYPAEDIDFIWYIEHTLINPIDQLFGTGYINILEKYKNNIYYEPTNSRCQPTSIITPIKMVYSLIKDFMTFYTKNQTDHTDKEKFEYICKTIITLPQWFIDKRKEVDDKDDDAVEIRRLKTRKSRLVFNT